MPSIPRFHVTQDAAFVYVHVRVPYVRVSEMEFHVEGAHFSFYCKPYLLKLEFPHELVDDDRAKAVFDPNAENGTIVVHVPKAVPEQVFEDLDLLTKLLQPTKTPVAMADLRAASQRHAAPLIEVLDSSATEEAPRGHVREDQRRCPSTDSTKMRGAGLTADSSLLELEKRFADAAAAETAEHQLPPQVTTDLEVRYGFNNAYSGVFGAWHGEVSEILSLPDPDRTPAAERTRLRELGEDLHFDVERYLLDFVNATDDCYFAMAMAYEPFWRQYAPVGGATRVPARPRIQVLEADEDPLTRDLAALALDGATPDGDFAFSDADRELLIRLPNKEFLLPAGSPEEDRAVGGLVDVLVGFVYEQLTTQGDSGVESAWTASILSPSLAWLDPTADMRAIVRTGVRRMLTFPLLRQFALAMRVLEETAALLRRGKRVVLGACLALYRILERSETQYLLNTVFVRDYCIWLQSVADARLIAAADELDAARGAFRKADTGWALEDMEQRLLADDDASSDEDSSDDDDDDDDGSESSSTSSRRGSNHEPPQK